MNTTLEIPEDMLQKAMRAAGTQSPQEAVVKALEEFNQRHGQAELIKYLGTFDDLMTPEELEHMRGQD
jgi:Arc/MetJ family transcription regulator